jgi:hypothetical protein
MVRDGGLPAAAHRDGNGEQGEALGASIVCMSVHRNSKRLMGVDSSGWVPAFNANVIFSSSENSTRSTKRL